MRKEVSCKSSKSHGAWLAGAVCRGRTTRSLQELGAGDGSSRNVCESRSMRVGVQRTRSREVFGGGQVECMGAVYLRSDRKLSTLMQEECMGGEYVHVDRELSTQIQSRGSQKRGSVRA
jgi:hypothetical protein